MTVDMDRQDRKRDIRGDRSSPVEILSCVASATIIPQQFHNRSSSITKDEVYLIYRHAFHRQRHRG